ncbi:acyltransferase family protein [Niabella beijingensis]|uniref:acyltransferase family protein n=1 Tax=Niabella beijingensis TaxID=2872700 RepID=UPI001CBD0550|nr:acyltransferase [Niabella beijingensis]MBZ4188195.1 acyltransferase [Niabella beijingensis]
MSVISKKLYGLDHLRALAILLVFLYHYRGFHHPAWIDQFTDFGWTGVDLFFVLSGFLIAGQLFGQLKTSGTLLLKQFFIKRFFRIIPPYLVVVALYFCFPFFREREALAPLWKFLTFTHNFGLDVIHKGTFSHAWSLCIEEQFYLTLPFILLLLYKSRSAPRVLFFLLLLLVLLLRWISWDTWIAPLNSNETGFWLLWYKYIYYPTYTRLDGLLIGVGLAWVVHYAPRGAAIISKNGNLFFLAGLPFLTAAWFICRDQASFAASIWGFLLVAVGFGCWVAAAAAPSSFLYKKGWFITEQLARLSFTIYLSHKGVIHMTQTLLERTGIATTSNLALLIAVFNCIAVGLLFRYLVENPCLQLRNRILKQRGVKAALQPVPAVTSAHTDPGSSR